MFPMKIQDALKVITPIAIRRKVLNVRFSSRMPTSSLRTLPDFLLIGAMRAGTSSLYKYLGSHPCVIPALRKEVKYFSSEYARGEAWYRCHFPTHLDIRFLQAIRSSNVLTFEASPDYLLHPQAAARAASLVPHAKILVMLRNPIDRAFSHYQHMFRLGYENLSFEDAIAQEPTRLAKVKAAVGERSLPDSKNFLRFSYFSRGLYAEQLAVWMEHFTPGSFLILSSEEFFAQPEQVYQAILSFLRLPDWHLVHFHNYSYLGAQKPKTQPPARIADAFRRELGERYAPYNQQLFGLLGRDFHWQ
jgi:hypothetical protein